MTSPAVKSLARFVGLAALAGTILPPVGFMLGGISLAAVKSTMLVAAVAWFVAAPFWMKVE